MAKPRISQEIIDKINSYPSSVNNRQITEEVWVNPETVGRHRLVKTVYERTLPPVDSGPKVTRKLSEEQVLQARAFGDNSEHDAELGELWGVHRNTVSKARRKIRYRHIA
jgi:hypothetical protein